MDGQEAGEYERDCRDGIPMASREKHSRHRTILRNGPKDHPQICKIGSGGGGLSRETLPRGGTVDRKDEEPGRREDVAKEAIALFKREK